MIDRIRSFLHPQLKKNEVPSLSCRRWRICLIVDSKKTNNQWRGSFVGASSSRLQLRHQSQDMGRQRRWRFTHLDFSQSDHQCLPRHRPVSRRQAGTPSGHLLPVFRAAIFNTIPPQYNVNSPIKGDLVHKKLRDNFVQWRFRQVPVASLLPSFSSSPSPLPSLSQPFAGVDDLRLELHLDGRCRQVCFHACPIGSDDCRYATSRTWYAFLTCWSESAGAGSLLRRGRETPPTPSSFPCPSLYAL